MKIGSLDGVLFAVPVDFDISKLKVKFSRHSVVGLDAGGFRGVGEGVLYKHDMISAQKALKKQIFPFLQGGEFRDFDEARQKLWGKFGPSCPSLVHALDMALWDAQGQKERTSLNKLLGRPKRNRIEITEQIFLGPIQEMEKRARKITMRGTRNLKIKVGRSPKNDPDILQAVASATEGNAIIRVDANQAYSPAQAVEVGKRFESLGVVAIEEPVPKKYLGEIKRIREETGLQIMLDESVMTLQDLKRAAKLGAIDILNLKLTRVGGISRALEFVDFCQDNDIKVSVGCNEELGVGMAAILHFSSVVKNLYSTEGVGTAMLGFDITDGKFVPKNGFLNVPEGNGLGVNFIEGKLRAASKRMNFAVSNVDKKSLKFYLQEKWNIRYNMWFNFWVLFRRKF